jgi:radical SAM superfamily enzyme YgiQ (UPF0313 family)
MRILLISANAEQINILPLPLGLNCVAVATRNAGHDVRFLDLLAEEDIPVSVKRAINAFDPEIIGISVRNIDDQAMTPPRFLLEQVKAMIDECRKLSPSPVVLGGAGYSIFPQSALEYLGADMGIQGEGEVVFPMLLDRIAKGRDLSGLPGLYLRRLGPQGERRFTKDLDSLPQPDAHLWLPTVSDSREFWVPIQTRRGCPMHCSYCSTATIEGQDIRKRSPELVIREIMSHAGAGFQRFYFVDNTFNIPLRYAKEICRKIIEHDLKITWRCIFYPGKTDRELADLMAGAGCLEASLGFESGSPQILRNMNKKFSLKLIRQTSDMLRTAGIKRMGFLMLGGPGETKETVEESLSFADSLKLDMLKITIGIRIYPGTDLAKAAFRDSLVSPEDDLLFPRFYIVREIEGWIRETVSAWMSCRPHWTM